MSTSIDSRSRPKFWSYLSFGSNPRRRSISLPTNKPAGDDPFEKAGRHASAHAHKSTFSGAWMNQSPRGRLWRVGGVIFLVICVFFFFSPGERARVGQFVGSKYPEPRVESSRLTSSLVDHPEGASATSAGGKCTKPFSPNKPLTQYALMIDAGSTGSRIHVYRFNNCGPTPELEHEEFKMTEKRKEGAGLSAYGDDPIAAAKSLDILMDVAMATVPEEYRSCSPIALKATAGLRLLGPEKSGRILEAVRTHLENDYPFPVVSKEKNGVVIMDGSEEGVYAWITTNYLLGKIGGPDNTPTAAVFDLGGGSTQIVFQPTFKGANGGAPEKMQEGDHKYALSFGGRDFELYQHSHLGYGLMEARAAIHRAVAAAHMEANPSSNSWQASPIVNPCIIPNSTETVKVTLEDKAMELTMVGPSVGSPAECRGIAEKILKKEAECKLAPCSFNGIHQPSLSKTFAVEDVYIFSYFYDRLQPLGMPESFTLREMRDLTAKVCEGEDSWGTFVGTPGAIEELQGRPEHCLDLNFMMALLHTGYEMPIDREVRIAKKIKGNELGWCLGAR